MHISRLFSIDRLETMIKEGMVSTQGHPTNDELVIYNYTKTCQFKGCWNSVTLNTRGLILDRDYEVIARPFTKFFNIEERSRSDIIWKQPFQIFEKLDGSLGILYPDGDEFKIATRGSFVSDQAIHGTAIYKKFYEHVPLLPGYTYLFEIIYPENKIVVNYGGLDDLVFLGAVNIETGANIFDIDWPGPTALTYKIDPSIHPRDIKEKFKLKENNEGFVLYFPNKNERVKVKYDWYLERHRAFTSTSTKTIWEYLSHGNTLESLIEILPDEMYSWVIKIANSLREDFDTIYQTAQKDFYGVLDELYPKESRYNQKQNARRERKEFALLISRPCYQYKSLMFNMLDSKSCDESIWKLVRPEYGRPYSVDADLDEEV